jgi:hypothetical protein
VEWIKVKVLSSNPSTETDSVHYSIEGVLKFLLTSSTTPFLDHSCTEVIHSFQLSSPYPRNVCLAYTARLKWNLFLEINSGVSAVGYTYLFFFNILAYINCTKGSHCGISINEYHVLY